ncbi:hypothetical protein BDF19DRAFT_421958 [Syncephalis fuscata]|nr:hypothetical protein BDF19DRAFT_421958 [Syncephalis fuscata]
MVRILLGPTREELQTARVNDAEHPHWIVSEHFRGFVTVRVKDFDADAPSPAIERMRAAMAQKETASVSTSTAGSDTSSGAYESAPEEQEEEDATAAATAAKALDVVDKNDPERIAWRKDVRRQHDNYFNNRNRMFVIQWSGQYLPTKPTGGAKEEKTAWTADDVWFTQEVDRGIPLPWGFNILLNVCRLIVPSFYADHAVDPVRPWTGSRMVCHVNLMNASDPVLPSPPEIGPSDENNDDGPSKEHPHFDEEAIQQIITDQWQPDGIVENDFIEQKKTKKKSIKSQLRPRKANRSEEEVSKTRGRQRRKHFHQEVERKNFELAPECVYSCEFFSDQLDPWRMNLKLGISLDVASTLGDQPLRFILRSRTNPEVVFFVVQLEYYP